MNGGPPVRVIQRARDRPQQTDDPQRLVSDTVAKKRVQCLPVDHLGHQVRAVTVIRELIQSRNCLVLEGDIRPQLEHEPAREAHVTSDAGLDRPHGHSSMEARMLCLVDNAKAVGLDLAEDTISPYVLTVAIAAHVNPLAMKL